PAGALQPARDGLEVGGTPARRGVAPVGERVDDEVRDSLPGGQLDAGLDVLPARVDAAVGDEPDQMQPASRGGDGALAGGAQDLVLEEAPVGDRVVDPRQILLDDRSGAEVE